VNRPPASSTGARIGLHVGRAAAAYGFTRAAQPGKIHLLAPDRFEVYWDELEKRGLASKILPFEAPTATDEELARFHTPDYLRWMRAACAVDQPSLDQGPTPAQPHIPAAAAAVAGACLDAARRLARGDFDAAFLPIAGFHHAWPERARQYCAINDSGVLLRFLAPARVAYVDIDAHLGDGVLGGAGRDAGLFIVDVHQRARTFWYSKFDDDEPDEPLPTAQHHVVALEPRSGDDAFFATWDLAIRSIERHRPEWVVLNAGVDGLKGDLLGGLRYTSAVHRRVIADLLGLARGRLIVVGGGGYGAKRAASGWCEVTAALLEHSSSIPGG